jgi:small subunit ribosomal protein S1
MSSPDSPESPVPAEPEESFDRIFSQYEKSRSHRTEDRSRQLEGTVVAVSADSVFLDIGFKSEGILPRSAFESSGESVQVGDKVLVSVKGRDADGYYELSRSKIEQPKDWSALERAFAEATTIVGTVTGVIKGGLSVDVGVRAFLPASRSGARDDAEMERLVGQEIRCRIIKLDVSDEDVVVDRRAIAEAEERSLKERRYSELREGDTVHGTVRTLTDYGAFIDIGGVDALLHVGDIAWGRIAKPADVLSAGQEIEAKVLKIEPEKHRISLGMKQLQPHPWDRVPEQYRPGERVRGTVTRLVEFGAFVELAPGVEGLIHISEMSWGRKVKKAGDVVKPGETVEAVILSVTAGERRIALGLKQALGDPWADAKQKFPVGAVIEGPVTNITKFGAFVQLAEGVEGMIHVSEISPEKRINHPTEVLRVGQPVKAQVVSVDPDRRQFRLSIKQLVPTGLDEYIAEHDEGDLVTGRVMELPGGYARVELGDGVQGTCRLTSSGAAKSERTEPAEDSASSHLDLSSLGAMLQARWKGGSVAGKAQPEVLAAGQIRKFRVTKLDKIAKTIELELAHD